MCVVIPTSEIIQPGFFVIDVTTVAEGVEFAESIGQGTGGEERLTPGIVGVFYHFGSSVVKDADDITLEVMDIGEFLGGCAVIPFNDSRFAGGCMFLFAVWAVFPAINRCGKAAAVVKTPGSARLPRANTNVYWSGALPMDGPAGLGKSRIQIK